MSLKNKPTFKSGKIKVGISIGDPSGCGPIVTLKAITRLKGIADFVVIGDAYLLKGLPRDSRLINLNNIERKGFEKGKIKAKYGRASIEYLDKAQELLINKEIDCLVTAPISKEAINKAGFSYSGHTEYFLKKSGVKEVAMLLLNKFLKFSLVTRHLALKDVPRALTRERLYNNILTTYKSLNSVFAIKNPRLVVCGLNPHASDNGLIGNEEQEVIKPVLQKIRNKFRITIDGPLSVDVAIYQALMKKHDCVIAIYHDQALISLKLTDFGSGVNMTLGLPFIRTSPLHGTAFDIVKNPRLVNPDSMIAAIKLAIKCALNQRKA
ncbi:MAG: 4-hydroxythreonine-4-phosphate dehydrogenase PdxA [Candidatus Omnitrophica bacterium]|nr:4-hydroxythreonine-4-phosphate dehydrogenase PdxA [Candidatus Omnitrophota bacterium]